MSKSLGNFFTVRDLLDGHDGLPPVPGEVIRFVFLSTHYGKPMDWTAKKAAEAEATLRKWRTLTKGVEPSGSVAVSVIAALADDLNTAGAIAELHKLAGLGDAAGLLAGAQMIGLLSNELGDWITRVDLSDYENLLAGARAKAMESKDFSDVDRIKHVLVEAGVEVRMSKAGVELLPAAGFDASKLEGLK